jgi:putative hydrolase of the HAD superfamily
MESTQTTKVVLFDLDNTLFDHHHSLRSAISAVQEKYASLAGNEPEDLIARYNSALQRAYDKYLCKEITYEETDIIKIQLFFTQLGLPEPTPEEASEFRAIYKPAYRANRRATTGSIETLIVNMAIVLRSFRTARARINRPKPKRLEFVISSTEFSPPRK